MAASINDLTSPAGQASAAVDVVRAFLDVATAVGGRATFYNTTAEQLALEASAHTGMLELDRGVYAAVLAGPGITDRARQVGVRLRLGRPWTVAAATLFDEPAETMLLGRIVAALPVPGRLKLFGELGQQRPRPQADPEGDPGPGAAAVVVRRFVAEFECLETARSARWCSPMGAVLGMERAPSVAYWDTLWAPLLRGCYGAEMVRRQQAGAPARPLATRVPLDTAGTGSLEELADALDAADRAERRRTRDRITRGGARTRRSWPTTLATATWTERGWRPLLVSGLWASSSAAAAGSCTRRWSRGRVSRDPCSRVMAGVAFPEGSLGGARVALPAEQRGRDPAGAGSGRRPADREGQAFVLLAYPGLLAASAQIVEVWQAHADGDHVEIFVTDDPGYVAGLGDNDPEAEVDPVPFLDRDGVAPNGMINGRERLVPGDRLLWLGATDGTAECTAVLFETSCHCQVIGRTWNPEVLARRRSLLLHALTLDESPAAMIGPTRRALALPVPRVWAPRHPDASNGWARVDAKPPPTAYWLPQLHSVGRDARASGTGGSPGPW